MSLTNYCDRRQRLRNMVADHCTKDRHCILNTGTCAMAWIDHDHGKLCCDCQAIIEPAGRP